MVRTALRLTISSASIRKVQRFSPLGTEAMVISLASASPSSTCEHSWLRFARVRAQFIPFNTKRYERSKPLLRLRLPF